MDKKLISPVKNIIAAENIEKINIIGDPGCDGLGAATMSIFAKALIGNEFDLTVIAGDLVPFGSRQFYRNVKCFINQIAGTPVYSVCGNHDTKFYEEYFGLRNYAIVNPKLTVIVLDNSERSFSEETLNFFNKALKNNKSENFIVVFHIPPPNSYTGNSVSAEAWQKMKDIYFPCKDKIKYFISGHVHSYFEDNIDGIPLIVTGGGGARIEDVNSVLKKDKVQHHIVKIYFDSDNELTHEYLNLENIKYDNEVADSKLLSFLETAFSNEAVAHFRYKLLSELSESSNLPRLSKLFKALSDSEYRHAKNHFYVMNKLKRMEEFLEDSIRNEDYEVNEMYKNYLNYAENNSHGLAAYTFFDSREAEKIHEKLLKKALSYYKAGNDIPEEKYFTCSSCGYTFHMKNKPRKCPVCGAPKDKIIPVF
ncbi:MAG: metallophosphoesterase [Victivallales bacterium]|nr:metallophosphoesterase [Victivallales bacterium]